MKVAFFPLSIAVVISTLVVSSRAVWAGNTVRGAEGGEKQQQQQDDHRGAVAVIADSDSANNDRALAKKKKGPFVICEDQTAVYCGLARCWALDQVAYCKCNVQSGDSFSAKLTTTNANIPGTGRKSDACDYNELGGDGNGYLLSTYFLDESPGPPTTASYVCDKTSSGAYAQCDGGFCFGSTMNNRFPYFGTLSGSEIICSCPITKAPEKGHTFVFAGPYDPERTKPKRCKKKEFKKFCTTKYSKGGGVENGEIIPVGGPPGVGEIASAALAGKPVKIKRCFQKKTK